MKLGPISGGDVPAALAALVVAVVIAWAGVAYAQTCNQGSPGHQGPWAVYLMPAPGVLSKADDSFLLTPSIVPGTSSTDTIESVPGSLAGQACAIGVPAGFNASLGAFCIPGNGTVDIRFTNPTLVGITPIAGTYTVVTF